MRNVKYYENGVFKVTEYKYDNKRTFIQWMKSNCVKGAKFCYFID